MTRRTLLRAALAAASATAWPSVWAALDPRVELLAAITRDHYINARNWLAAGADPNMLDDYGRPALVFALSQESWRVVDVLLQAPGLDVNLASRQGETALMMASIRGSLPHVRRLIEMQADVNRHGWTPLHYAASADRPDSVAIAHVLLEHHAYIDAESPNGSTPLMLAAQYGSENMVHLLLEQGADSQLRNQLGLNVVDFAKRSDRGYMVQWMEAVVRATHRPKGTW